MEENKVAVEAQAAEAPVKETKKAPLNASVAPDQFDWDAFEKRLLTVTRISHLSRLLMTRPSLKYLRMRL